tara:strand:- start:368 stop:748 length:381 start_codon:yes stop_codon:yes gene_type:complete
MNTPVDILHNKLPQQLLNKIQQYLPVNENIRIALDKYYDKLYDKKMIDDEKAFEKYVYPNCECSNCPDNGHNKIYKRKDCSVCFEYEIKEYNGEYTNAQFYLVCVNNPQYNKIKYGEYDNIEHDIW